ncbi:MAG TPA: metal-dependent hydrolase [Methanomicrobiales archaeon]|nr:metal-dependent hydrolase [Methanomicrobiales archaeon]
MDSVTHALAASSLFLALGHPALVPFAALGAVSMDADVLLLRFPRKDPGHYVFTHGGFTHSIAGCLVVGGIFFAAVAVATLAGPGAWLFGAGLGPAGLLALLAGALTHVTCDFLAYPGIPVLYPLTDRKFTLGVFAGPSILLLVASWGYLATLLLGVTHIADYRVWAAIFLGYIGAKALLKLFVALTTDGATVPTKNPLKWFAIRDLDGTYSIQARNLLGGPTEPRVFPKFTNVSPAEVEGLRGLPEVRRHRYNSYVQTVEKNGETVTFRDPFRTEGFTRYPFDHVTVDVISGKAVPAPPSGDR